MGQDRAINYLQDKSTEAWNDLMEQWDTLQTENAEAQDNSAMGRLLGGGAGLLLGSYLGLPLWGTMLLTGAGSRGGSELGEHWEGGLDFSGEGVQGAAAIKPVGLRSDKTREIRNMADDMYAGYDVAQNVQSFTDMGSAYFAGSSGIDGAGMNMWDMLMADTDMDFGKMSSLYSKHVL